MAKEARKKTRFWNHPVTLVLGALVTIYMCFQVYSIFTKKTYTSDLLHKSVTEQTRLQTEYSKTKERLLLLDNPIGKDMFYREKQNYVEDGEEVYVIVREALLPQATTTTTRTWADILFFWR